MEEKLGIPYRPPARRREALLGSVCVEDSQKPKVEAMADALNAVSTGLPDSLVQTWLRRRVLYDGLVEDLDQRAR